MKMSSRTIGALQLFALGAAAVGFVAIFASYWSASDIPEIVNPRSALGGGGQHLALALCGGLSILGATVLAFRPTVTITRAVLAGSIIVAIPYAIVGLWPFALASLVPAWWLYRAQHEV